jgi:hypothetical protein
MKTLTREQRKAVKRIYDRGLDWFGEDYPTSYREFRKSLVHGFDCAMIPAAGMWIGIETDGYTHT